MIQLTPETKKYLRTLLVLGRVSNLPTVWSNCLAGWLISGARSIGSLVLLCAGATALYIGGMYLNDAFDVEFDRLNRKERPIPSGAISVGDVWGYGLSWLGLGLVLLYFFNTVSFTLAVALVFSILLYDAVHKAIAFSPILMATCRFFLFVMAASVGPGGVTGLSVWSASALFCYIVGLSFVAKSESNRGPIRYWPCLLLLTPLFLAWLVNAGIFRKPSLLLSIILFLWILRCVYHTFMAADKNIGRTVSGLLAGIVLVDMLACTGAHYGWMLLFAALFGSALLFQRYIPAT
ncbi:MAG TPA: UbiA family prenyltransferase [Verrucomicrobiae bacterium]|nr:UbiA family prenyltransferase [Verrucomicrobiae bacterium]